MNKNWTKTTISKLFDLPFADLLFRAQKIHRKNFDPNTLQIHTLLSAKTGDCSENCAYCPQSANYQTGVKKQKLLSCEQIIAAATKSKQMGIHRFCIATQGKTPGTKDFSQILKAIKAIKKLGLKTCATLGELTEQQIQQLEQAGLDSYNHNLDTSAEFYSKIITSHTFEDRLATLKKLSKSNINICCGGIIGMGESIQDRINLLLALTKLPKPPQVIPINLLIKIPGTPLENAKDIDPFDFARILAVTRITLPKSNIALAAGRNNMSDELQALCFLAGANIIHCGQKLLVTPLPNIDKDKKLLQRLGIKID